MKVLLTTLNAKYIHTSLALRYLHSYCNSKFEISLQEFTINMELDDILGKIYLSKSQVVAFSCYIWNIDKTLEVAANLKRVAPEIVIILGGPEVSFNICELMEEYPLVDFIVQGEGEESFHQLLTAIKNNHLDTSEQLFSIDGLCWRIDGKIIINKKRQEIAVLDSIPSPYQEDLSIFRNKIAYLEASRGCPYNCAYCLSSTISGVRFFSLERVKSELDKLINAGVKQVKFVDRTFNAHKGFAMEIWKHILFRAKDFKQDKINFHFEISANLLDDEMITFLQSVPVGLFQFEIGIQSTNSETLTLIDRRLNYEELAGNVSGISAGNNIHLHLDLIAGLPKEDYNTFANSFNQVIKLKPEKLQLGFLKLLKGSAIRARSADYGYTFTERAPYQVLENNHISYEQLLRLKKIEQLVDNYYNSHMFTYTFKYLLKLDDSSPFELFEELFRFWEERSYFDLGQSKEKLYEILLEFCDDKNFEKLVIRELLKLDLLRGQRLTQLPKWCFKREIPNLTDKMYHFLNNSQNRQIYFEGTDASFKNLAKKVHFEAFSNVIAPFINNEADLEKEETAKMADSEFIVMFNYNYKKEGIVKGAFVKVVDL